MSSISTFTYSDALEHGLAYLGSDVSAQGLKDVRRAILSSYRELPQSRRWSYYYQRGRIVTVPAQTAGTVQYTQSTNQMVLTGSTWPSWAALGVVTIANVAYKVAKVINSTTLQFDINLAPAQDIAANTPYILYQDTYTMPADFVAADQFTAMGASIAYPVYVHPSDWLIPQQFQQSPATPRRYTFTSDPNYFGAMAVRFQPAPDNQYDFDFIYTRRPQPLIVDSYKVGTVTVTNGSAAVTGTGTTFNANHVDCSFRVSGDNINYPTGFTGNNQFQFERMIVAVNSGTSITLDQPAPMGFTNPVKYEISDPVDLEDGAMTTAFLRLIELQLANTRRYSPQDKAAAEALYNKALILAMEADSRDTATRVAGRNYSYRPRLAYMPRGTDVS